MKLLLAALISLSGITVFAQNDIRQDKANPYAVLYVNCVMQFAGPTSDAQKMACHRTAQKAIFDFSPRAQSYYLECMDYMDDGRRIDFRKDVYCTAKASELLYEQ